MSRESRDEIRGDGTVYNGFDYALQVWVVDGLIDPCGGGSDVARRYAGYPVADVPGHQVRDRQPQGGIYAYLKDRGRIWVQSINTDTRSALVRFDPGEGMRSPCHKVMLSEIDFTREWRMS